MLNDYKKEFANPLIRPLLPFYPEDSGNKLEEARQATRWKNEVDPNLGGPMAREANGTDYFIEEPCFANLDDLGNIGPVMPVRWFTRNGSIYAKAHHLRLTHARDAFVIDATVQGCVELSLEAFFLSVNDLMDPECQRRYGIPPPSNISGKLLPPNSQY